MSSYVRYKIYPLKALLHSRIFAQIMLFWDIYLIFCGFIHLTIKLNNFLFWMKKNNSSSKIFFFLRINTCMICKRTFIFQVSTSRFQVLSFVWISRNCWFKLNWVNLNHRFVDIQTIQDISQIDYLFNIVGLHTLKNNAQITYMFY